MRAYADSSFILRLVTSETDSPAAIGEYRRHGMPALFFHWLHRLEIRNAVLQRAFHQRRSAVASDRARVARERDTALARLDRFLARRTLIDVPLEAEVVGEQALALSTAHTERIGARTIDILHVASALALETELFFTTDERQAQLARTVGLKVTQPSP